jgi:multicomponent K+:H+ antiporter subunit E
MRPLKPRSFLPNAFTFTLLFLVWLLLTHSFDPGNILLAVILAWIIPVALARVQVATVPVKKPLKALVFIGVLLRDIIISNVVVAKQVLGAPERLHPGFIAIPLDMSEALPITFLASTISLTPGTVSIEITEDKKTLYVHALHVENETRLVARIKDRYENPLKEIFGC